LTGTTAGLDVFEKGEISWHCRDSNPGPSRLQHSRYTDYAATTDIIKIKPGKEKQRKKADKDKRK
jgi:hypothetical protein